MSLIRCLVGRTAGRAIFGLVIGLVFALGACPASAQQVVVEGNQRVEAETVRSYMNLRPGGTFGPQEQDEALKALFGTGLFSDVRITREGGRIVVHVVENPVINRVAFEGNKKMDTATLRKEVESQPRGVYTQARVQADVQRIIDVYRRGGRFDARVEPKIIQLEQNRVDLVFEITEGEKTKIDHINFIGNHAFSERRLRDVITTTETNWLSWLKTSDVYDPDRLNVDQELLRRFYLKNGYADFRVISAVADYDRDRNAFFITFTVDEGELYHFGTVDIESNVAAVPADSIRSFVRTQPGATYNAELIDKTLEDMSVNIAQRGYPFAQVRPRGDRDVANHVVNLVFVVDDAPRVYVERINIRGNTRTMDQVIRREFDIAEGDALNRAMVDRAERRLNQLGYFKAVKITREAGSTSDRVVLNVNVDEQPTGEVSFGAGYSTSDGIIGDVSISEKNFLGRGQFVRASVGWGQKKRTVDLNFTEPYFLDRRLSFGTDFFYRRNLVSNTQSFNQEIIGGGVRLGLQITDDLSAQARYRAYTQRIDIPAQYWDCGPPLFPNLTPKPGTVANNIIDLNGLPDCLNNGEASAALKSAQGTAFYSTIGTTFVYNRLDQAKNPRNGIYAELNFDLAGVGGDVNFFRTTGEVRGYYNIYEDIVGMIKFQAGNVTGWGGQQVRLIDAFFKGPDLVRGFQSSGIGPRDISLLSRSDALGGRNYLGVSAELQFPFPAIPEELGLRGAVFADAGTLFGVGNLGTLNTWIKCSSVGVPANCNYFDDSWNIRSSVGASLIWQSPLGPLRFDFAFPLSKQPYDKTQVFRFSGGTTF